MCASRFFVRCLEIHVYARLFQVQREANKGAGTSFERFHEDSAESVSWHGPTLTLERSQKLIREECIRHGIACRKSYSANKWLFRVRVG